MRKNYSLYRMMPLLILCIIVASSQCKTTFTIVPIREVEFREEQSLPLDDSEIKSIVEFIADGGVHRDDGFQASVEHEPFRRFLLLLTNEANLTYGAFRALPGLKEFIDPEAPIQDVIDAREKKGPRGINRLAYRYKDFWFVFMVDKLSVSGRPIKDSERKFSRLIVMQVLDRTEITK